jgi:hypothetical protein
MRTVRLATICLAAAIAATLISGSALAKGGKPAHAPKNLRGFLLRPNERVMHTFPRTPAFSWAPVRGARCYEFELASSKSFTENSVIWSNVRYGLDQSGNCKTVPAAGADEPSSSSSSSSSTDGKDSSKPAASTTTSPGESTVIPPVKVPAVSVDIALPWFTGQPYALHSRVRAITSGGPTSWSKPFSFNMRWTGLPVPQKSRAGLLRWSTIEGATGYQVWYPAISKVFSTHTNVADQREFYTFHPALEWMGSVQWRVRAVRQIFGEIPNGLPAVSYGAWSPLYTSANPPPTGGKLTVASALSDRQSSTNSPTAHELMPGLTFTGNQGLDGRTYTLFRTYAFTDRDCVNEVFRGSVVGSPAFAPRTTGPLKLPTNDTDLDKALQGTLPDAASEGDTVSADGQKLVATESLGTGGSSSGSTASAGDTSGGSAATEVAAAGRVDLPDVDFPSTRYYWTVVPVVIFVDEEGGSYQYQDVEVPQDACAAGRVASFGKESAPVKASSGTPYVSGLTPSGRLLAVSKKRPVLYSTPLVAWKPTIGATAYEVQWSKSKYPWKPRGSRLTYSTSAVLELAPGTWYYRVRGLNEVQLKKPEMPWSSSIKLAIAKPKFRIAKG